MICVKCKKEVPDGPFCCQCGAKQERARPKSKRGNGLGTVIKRGKTFTAIISCGGYATDDGKYKRIRKSKGGFKTKTEAYSYMQSIGEEPTSRSKFSALLAAYKSGPFKKVSASKQTAYTIAADRWQGILHRDVDDITLGELQDVLDSKVSTYYPAKDMQTVLSHMFKIAMAQKMTSVNLARMLTLPKLEEEEPIPFEDEEVEKMWAAYAGGDFFLAYPLLMIYSGMMPGELLQLKECDVNLEAMEIHGNGIKTGTRKHGSIVFPPLVVPLLEELISRKGRTGRLVPYQKDNFYVKYYEALERAGVRRLPPYSCRHTTATALAKKDNIAISYIQQVMRHSKISTTQRYIHTASKEAHEAINAMGGDPQ